METVKLAVGKKAEDSGETSEKKVKITAKEISHPELAGIYAKVGEEVEPYEKKIGDLIITEIQMPELATWTVGKKYKLEVEVVMKEVRIKQDDKWQSKTDKRIATSNPYYKAEFEIIDAKPINQ